MSQATASEMNSSRMTHRSSDFAAGDGLRLHLQSWTPPGEPAAVLAVVHGYGEHGGRYQYLAEAMTARGLGVSAYDLRGHGQSAGARGHISRFADYLGDTRAFLEEVARRQPGAPVYLLGHSLGGLIATAYAEAGAEGLEGLILSTPLLRLGTPVPALKVQAARLLSRLAPGRDIGNPLLAEDLSHEPHVVAAYVTDPLNHHVATARWAAEVLAAQRAALSVAHRLTLPLLLLYAGADTVTDPKASRELFAAAAAADKVEHGYEGYYHELFNETGREAVFADLAAWLDSRLPG
ncbi:MAG: lysophospholipase, partial [Thermoleophilia bacterium]